MHRWTLKIEKHVRTTMFAKYDKRDKIRISVADNDTMWIEIYIPQKLRMPYSEKEISKHLHHMN